MYKARGWLIVQKKNKKNLTKIRFVWTINYIKGATIHKLF